MIDIKYIRDNVEQIKTSLNSKKSDFNINDVISIDKKRRDIINKVENLKHKRNKLNEKISNQKKNKKSTTRTIDEMKMISIEVKELDLNLKRYNEELNNKLLFMPNLVHQSVPIGNCNKDNVVVKEWGKKPKFNYDIKDHKKLCELNKLIDFQRSAKISGAGFPLYTNKGARFERGLINFMLDTHIDENKYTEIFPPFLVTSKSPKTTGNLPKFNEDMYYISKDDLYCIPTAEVPLTNIHTDEVFKESDLPIKYVAYSACFRREAGSYGKETKGLLRLHQFNKVELVKFVSPKSSYEELELLLNDAEKILQKLNLHYRVIELCSADLSFSASKCYDIEVWSPFEEKYLEVSSCSNFESFQSRRGSIKYRDKITNKLLHLHTLNGSGLATPRLMVSLLETYQDSNGSINLPKPLHSYLNFKTINV